jgi:hypothetical protein
VRVFLSHWDKNTGLTQKNQVNKGMKDLPYATIVAHFAEKVNRFLRKWR